MPPAAPVIRTEFDVFIVTPILEAWLIASWVFGPKAPARATFAGDAIPTFGPFVHGYETSFGVYVCREERRVNPMKSVGLGQLFGLR